MRALDSAGDVGRVGLEPIVIERADAVDVEIAPRIAPSEVGLHVFADAPRSAKIGSQVLRAERLIGVGPLDVDAAGADLARPAWIARISDRSAIREITVPPADPGRSVGLLMIAVADAQARLPLTRGDGDDVDDTGEGVRAIERRARPAHHLDPFDLIDVDGERLPEGRAQDIIVDRAAIDEHEELVGEAAVEAAHPRRSRPRP